MTFFFDLLTALFIVVDVALLATLGHQLGRHIRGSERRPGHIIVLVVLLFLILLAGGVVIYGTFIEPRRLVVREETLILRPDGAHILKLALISDLHTGGSRDLSEPILRVLTKSVELSDRVKALLIAGDFVSFGETDGRSFENFGHLDQPSITYGVFGNHDYMGDARALEEKLESDGVQMLKNEYALLGPEDAPLAIVGVDDLWFGAPDLATATEGIPAGVPKILLAHNPDIVYALGDERFDAIFAAHTHGGQIRLPWIGAVPPLPTVLGKAYDQGVLDWDGTPLVITRGIGVTGPRARFFAPPELMILTIQY